MRYLFLFLFLLFFNVTTSIKAQTHVMTLCDTSKPAICTKITYDGTQVTIPKLLSTLGLEIGTTPVIDSATNGLFNNLNFVASGPYTFSTGLNLTSHTVTNTGVLSLIGSGGTTVSASTGNVIISSTSSCSAHTSTATFCTASPICTPATITYVSTVTCP
jgi:hypothetical protein